MGTMKSVEISKHGALASLLWIPDGNDIIRHYCLTCKVEVFAPQGIFIESNKTVVV